MVKAKDTFNHPDSISLGPLSIGPVASATTLLESWKVVKGTAKPAKALIPALKGAIKLEELGTTLIHEHFLWFAGPMMEYVDNTPIPDALQTEIDNQYKHFS